MSTGHPYVGPIRFGSFEVDTNAGELRKQGVKVKLQDQPLQILQVLLEHPGEVVNRNELQRRIWPADTFVDFDHGLYNAIKRLREALGDSADNPRFIETVPRHGYRFVGPVIANGGPAADRQEASLQQPIRNNLRVVASALASVLLLLVIVMALPNRMLRFSGNVPSIHSIAVLPLKNLPDDPNDRYLAYGMAEELITDLSQIDGLRVVSHAAVNRYQDTGKPVSQIARELRVDAVVEGAVQRSGDRVRVTAQLIQASDEANLWAKTFDGEIRDVLALQSSVAGDIADLVQLKMIPDTLSRQQRSHAVDFKAVEEYWKGRYHLSLLRSSQFIEGRQQLAQEEIQSAVENFQNAFQIDPHYALAYLGYSEAVGDFGNGWGPHPDLEPKARWAVTQALRLDDQLPQAHLAMAEIFYSDWKWPEAEKEYRRALQLDPNFAEAHWCYAAFLYAMGRTQEGTRHQELQLALDPDLDHTGFLPGLSLEQQIELKRRFIQTHKEASAEAYWGLYLLLAKTGRREEALAELERGLTRYGWTESVAALQHGYARGGYEGALREGAGVLEAKWARHEYFPPNVLAYVYGILGDKNRAFAWMEKAYDVHDGSIASMKAALDYEPLRSDPRFADMLRRVGLPQ